MATAAVTLAPVSGFTKFEHEAESFFSKVKSELHSLFSKAPSFVQTATATITYVAPLVELIVGLVDPLVEPEVAAIITKIESALAAAQVVIKNAGPTPTLLTYLNAINGDIAQVITAAQVKDPATSAKLTAITGTITGEINAIIAELKPATV